MSKIRYYLLLTANPLSDSKAAEKIFKTITRLDILSRDLKIFMPGFHTKDGSTKDSKEQSSEIISSFEEYNKTNHDDYHGKSPIYHTYCESAGDMYFNDTDFAQFMLDLEDKSSNFEYLGRTELVMIPTESGSILYDRLCSFNLEPFIEGSNHAKCSVEEFILSVIRLILRDSRNESLELLAAIKDLYEKKLELHEEEGTTKITIRIDTQILEHMKWRENDEIFFISYSTKDEFDAFALKVLLEKKGKHVWIAPDGIPSGFDYAVAIPAALRITTRFVVLLSHNSANSGWVRREIDRAINEKKRIDGIYLDGFTIDDVNKYDHLSFLLANVQLRYNITELFNKNELLLDFLTT